MAGEKRLGIPMLGSFSNLNSVRSRVARASNFLFGNEDQHGMPALLQNLGDGQRGKQMPACSSACDGDFHILGVSLELRRTVERSLFSPSPWRQMLIRMPTASRQKTRFDPP